MEYASPKIVIYRLIRYWGMIVRFLWYLVLGILAYIFIDPQSLADIPFSDMTFRMLATNIFFPMVALGLFGLFMSFPVSKISVEDLGSEENELVILEASPYINWAWFSLFA